MKLTVFDAVRYKSSLVGLLITLWLAGAISPAANAGVSGEATAAFPPPLDSYGDAQLTSVFEILAARISAEPFNLLATFIFFCAITHTFMASKFMAISHARERAHQLKIQRGEAREGSSDLLAGTCHFLGEVEVVFGLWVIPLVVVIVSLYDWSTMLDYMDHGVNLTEASFVVVIMVLAATRPILRLGEHMMNRVAGLLGGSLAAFWFSVITVGPLLGSFITEPAAMTICALLLSKKFYALGPGKHLKYATLGLLFTNISVGGTLTSFAAPPVLMVAGHWNWGTDFMMSNFGWKAILGSCFTNVIYFWVFKKEFAEMQDAFALRQLKENIARTYVPRQLIEDAWKRSIDNVEQEVQLYETLSERATQYELAMRSRVEAEILHQAGSYDVDPSLLKEAIDRRLDEIIRYKLRRFIPRLLPESQRGEFHDPDWDKREDPVPGWITIVHLIFMGWTIVNAHHPEMFVLGLLFFLGFAQVTFEYQNRINLQTPMLVGFFLAGLVIHGGLQGWWIAPVLGSLTETPLMLGATVLTAFNDNAAITYLSTLVPGFTDGLKYAVVAGAVTGGGLTVIANAPNPAGQSLLKKHFDKKVSPGGLLLAALPPTIIQWLIFSLL